MRANQLKNNVFFISFLAAPLMLSPALADEMTDGSEPIASVSYACADGKTIDAVFFPDKADVKLSDGRELSLPQTISASGVRYAEDDDALVFWTKGKTAFITEGADAQETFSDCAEAG